MYNIAAIGSVDREFSGPSKGQIGPFKGSEGGGLIRISPPMFGSLTFLRKHIFLVRFLRMHPAPWLWLWLLWLWLFLQVPDHSGKLCVE